jgi:hypothetical protein
MLQLINITYSPRATNQATPALPYCLIDVSLTVSVDIHLGKDPSCDEMLKIYLPQLLHVQLHWDTNVYLKEVKCSYIYC